VGAATAALPPLPLALARGVRGLAGAFGFCLAGAAALGVALRRCAALGCAGVFEDFAILSRV